MYPDEPIIDIGGNGYEEIEEREEDEIEENLPLEQSGYVEDF